MTQLSGPPSAAVLAVGALTGLVTLLGGSVALRFRTALDLFLGFSSGAVIGVALFDLLPEALRLGAPNCPVADMTTAMAIGFAAYFVVDRITLLTSAQADVRRSHLGAASLTLHSFVDGLGIGLAFKVSATAGAIVALAVLAHDLLDGMNTVTVSLSGRGDASTARRWLIADAAAPIVGIGVSSLLIVTDADLALLLALFAGFFLYIGASELLPLSHQRRPHFSTVLATIGGMGLIFIVVRLAGG